MSQRLSRFFAMAVLVLSAGSMLALPLDAEARRSFGGGKSFGTQSSNVTNQRSAVPPPAANTTRNATAPAAGAAAGTAAASRSGMSRFLGPLAGIAAGLGIAALLSHLGLGGALLEFLSSAILIALVVFAIMFLVRKLRGGGRQPAMAQAGNNSFRNTHNGSSGAFQRPSAAERPAAAPAPSAAPAAAPAVAPVPAAPVDTSWFIPENFDTPAFLASAKQQFIKIQALWDSGSLEELREYMTDDLIAEIKPELLGREEGRTDVVLLNAELLGIEQVSGGHLASVRYSGMLRETGEAEAFRFEEVWNLYKGENTGWLLAGIQQIPLDQAS